MYFLSLFYLQVCWNISYNNQLIEDRTSYEFKISSERISSFPSVITRLVHLNLEHSVSPQEIWGRGGLLWTVLPMHDFSLFFVSDGSMFLFPTRVLYFVCVCCNAMKLKKICRIFLSSFNTLALTIVVKALTIQCLTWKPSNGIEERVKPNPV